MRDWKVPEKLVFIKTFGCQMNAHDSQRMLEVLEADGFGRAETPRQAQLILINTCTVRERSRDKVLSAIGRYAPLKETRPYLVLGVTGCLAQQEGARLLKQAKGLDLVMSPDHIASLPELVARAQEGERTVKVGFSDEDEHRFLQAAPGPHDQGRPGAMVTIQKGCDNHCAYCIVPSVRGPEVSRPADEIVQEVRHLVDTGTRDVTLIGQNVNSYQGGQGVDFVTLLEQMDQVAGLLRVRFTTSHPKDFTPRLASSFGALRTLCPWLHLPVQSGSTRVLSQMKRGYTREQYLELITRVRTARPDITLGTDLIVGFPGETEEDFLETASLLEEIRYDYSYSFKYSVRPGTPASELGDPIPEEEKHRRLRHLQGIIEKWNERRLARWMGQEVEVLVEGPSRRGGGQISGRSPGNQVVNFQGQGSEMYPGDLVIVRVNHTGLHSMRGELVQAVEPAQ